MEKELRVGFCMHPNWLGPGGDLSAFAAPLRRAGLADLEFELDEHLPRWADFGPLMEAAVDAGLDLSFHAPYRAPYHLTGFASGQGEAIQRDYRPMLAIADEWGRRLGSLRTVVIHAAVAPAPADRAALEADTIAFLRWALEAFPHLRFALENNSPARADQVKVGDQLAGVLAVLRAVPHPRLVACWDLGHDFLKRGPGPAPQEWLAIVRHAHVHDVNERGEDHYPLIYDRVPYPAWLGAWRAAGGAGVAVLELKGGNLQGWAPEDIGAALLRSVTAVAQAFQER